MFEENSFVRVLWVTLWNFIRQPNWIRKKKLEFHDHNLYLLTLEGHDLSKSAEIWRLQARRANRSNTPPTLKFWKEKHFPTKRGSWCCRGALIDKLPNRCGSTISYKITNWVWKWLAELKTLSKLSILY